MTTQRSGTYVPGSSARPLRFLYAMRNWRCSLKHPLLFLLYFNFFQFLFTAIPMRYRVICRGFESDGLQIIHILKHNKAS